jgi:hypothetical protein
MAAFAEFAALIALFDALVAETALLASELAA